jgi:DNA polymerase-3 subunit alpha
MARRDKPLNDFTHLHTHLEYSLLDSIIRIPDLVKQLQTLGMTSCAITDHGVMGGCVKFYKAMKTAGLKPLLGSEVYLTNQEDSIEPVGKARDNYHLVVIAKYLFGYQTLMKLLSEAAIRNFYYKPRISKSKLHQLSGHVIATSACLGGELANQGFKRTNDPGGPPIHALLDYYLNIFGEDFYLEVQDQRDTTQQEYNQYIIQLSKDRGIPLVITTDAHYLTQKDHELHQLVMAFQLGKTLQEYRDGSLMHYGEDLYIKSPEEMMASVKRLQIEEAYWNTLKIRDQCNVELQLGGFFPPIYDKNKK